MFLFLLQATDSLRAPGPPAGPGALDVVAAIVGTLAFWASLASIVGLGLTVWSLVLARRSLKDARDAQKGAEDAQRKAEALRDQYARKQRLPQLRDNLNDLATKLDTALINYPASEVEARESAVQISRTIQFVLAHLDGDHKSEVERVYKVAKLNVSLASLGNGQKVRSCARETSLYLTYVIDDERAKSI